MIPSRNTLNTSVTEQTLGSATYRIKYDENRVVGTVDGIEAVKQAVYLILNTERYAFPIYSWDYGVEFVDLYGMDKRLAIPEIQRRIREALLQDERISTVDNFNFENDRRKLHVTFTVTTVYGHLDGEAEVNV